MLSRRLPCDMLCGVRTDRPAFSARINGGSEVTPAILVCGKMEGLLEPVRSSPKRGDWKSLSG